MTSQEFSEKILPQLPDTPGVYLFKDASGKVLYVGKATSLRDRVRSYFSADLIATRGRRLVDMVTKAASIDTISTDSVLEALISEANLIKYHQPLYNIEEKDNRSWNYVVITEEEFPKVLLIRGRVLASETNALYRHIFGPFPYGSQLREALKIIRKIFPFRDEKCVPANVQIAAGKKPRPCFNRQIGLCPGVCTGEISREAYAEHIAHFILFFQGKKKELIATLEKEMNKYAAAEKFEEAAHVRKTIFALTHIQDIALLKRQDKIGDARGGAFFQNTEQGFRIEAYDVAHSSGTHTVGVMTVVTDGEPTKSDYRKFRIRTKNGGDTGALQEILRRRLDHLEWPLPQLIVVDGGQAQINTAKKLLAARGFTITLAAVVKDEHHKPRDIIAPASIAGEHKTEILLANAEAHRFAVTYHRRRRDRLS